MMGKGVDNITGSLGFRLTVASYVVVAVFMTIATYVVYRVSKDSIQMEATTMVRQMAEDLQLPLKQNKSPEELGDHLLRSKVRKSGSTWIMDREGNLLYNPDPVFRDEYIIKKKKFGNVMVSLQSATPRAPGQGSFKEKLADIAQKYEEGFGTYRQFGEERILAFHSLPVWGLLLGVDEPVTSANSELERIKKFISYTAIVSALLIMAFNLLTIRVIIRPYYREVEDLNFSLEHSNHQLENINARLAVSNRNLTTLYEVGLGMRHSLALRDILTLIINGAYQVLDVDRISIMLPDPEGNHLECHAVAGTDGSAPDEARVPISTQGGALATAFQRKEVIRIEDGQRIPPSLRLGPPWSSVPFLRSRAFVVVPLVAKDLAVGVIAMDNKSRRQSITEDQVNLLGIFANQAAVAVDNARLYDKLRQKIHELDARVDQLSILHQIGNSMQRAISRSEALGFIMRGISEGIGFTEVALALVNREEDLLQGEVGLGIAEQEVKALRVPLFEEENLMVMAAAKKRPVGIVHHTRESLTDITSRPLEEGAYRVSIGEVFDTSKIAVMAVPLIAREEVVGVIVVARREPPVVKRSDVELLLLYANTAGLTVERAELYGKLRQNLESLEITDHISRLFTYRYGQQRLHEEIAKSTAARQPLAAVMIGVDDFKQFNERCGLEVGDRTLAEIGEIVRTSLRASDIAFRYGGRLIAIIMPGMGRETGAEIAGLIRERMTKHRFLGPDGQRNQVITVSIGVVGYSGDDPFPGEDEIFKSLLGHLHRAEALGGNRIFVAEG